MLLWNEDLRVVRRSDQPPQISALPGLSSLLLVDRFLYDSITT